MRDPFGIRRSHRSHVNVGRRVGHSGKTLRVARQQSRISRGDYAHLRSDRVRRPDRWPRRSCIEAAAADVSIIIKALNEEEHIAAAIQSAPAALREIDGEVILADGGSSDRTIDIARRYPIGIVQLNRAEDRSCGSGAQLGFQYSRGRYLLLMDGDMRLHPGFLPVAIETLARSPGLAGVGGVVCEPVEMTEEYQQRRKRHNPDRRAGRVTRLDGCGLYRRAAIELIGYLTDRNLHAAEELDLGARLHSASWTLIKLDRTMVYHEPHKAGAYRLLLRHVFSRRACAVGELIRAATSKPHFWFILRHNRQWLVCLLVTGWWIALLATVPFLPGSLPCSSPARSCCFHSPACRCAGVRFVSASIPSQGGTQLRFAFGQAGGGRVLLPPIGLKVPYCSSLSSMRIARCNSRGRNPSADRAKNCAAQSGRKHDGCPLRYT